MKVQTGYRRLRPPLEDAQLYLAADMGGGELDAATRVIPDCGHAYFIRSHEANSPPITPLCRGCTAEAELREARRIFQEVEWTRRQPEVRG